MEFVGEVQDGGLGACRALLDLADTICQAVDEGVCSGGQWSIGCLFGGNVVLTDGRVTVEAIACEVDNLSSGRALVARGQLGQ